MSINQGRPIPEDEPIEVLKGSWIEELGSNWTYAGWCLFLLTWIAPFAAPTATAHMGVFALFGLLLVVWWILDIIDQRVPAWQIVAGVAMLAFGAVASSLVCYGFILIVATWVIYMLRIRES
jgi:hypothetical protein